MTDKKKLAGVCVFISVQWIENEHIPFQNFYILFVSGSVNLTELKFPHFLSILV